MACHSFMVTGRRRGLRSQRLRAFLLIAIAFRQTPVPSVWRDEGPLTPACTASSITGGERCIKKKQIFYTEQ